LSKYCCCSGRLKILAPHSKWFKGWAAGLVYSKWLLVKKGTMPNVQFSMNNKNKIPNRYDTCTLFVVCLTLNIFFTFTNAIIKKKKTLTKPAIAKNFRPFTKLATLPINFMPE
jgi:hypothetical protein